MDPANYILEYAPTLRDEWLTLVPFMDVISSYSAGPQPQCKHDSMDTPQHITLDFSVWKDGECLIPRFFKITANGVTLETVDGNIESSMRQLYDFLRQLPRDPESFANY